jgi:hypothetical protein
MTMRPMLLSAALMLLSGCGSGTPTLDCTNEATLQQSIEEMAAATSEGPGLTLGSAVAALTVDHALRDDAFLDNAVADQQTMGAEMLEALKPYHGKTASELIAAAEALKSDDSPATP